MELKEVWTRALSFLKSPPFRIRTLLSWALVAILALALGVTATKLVGALSEKDRLIQVLHEEQQINDSTQALLTTTIGQRDSLRALYDAADDMDGEVVAGVEIIIQPDTVYVPLDTALTHNLPDSTRVATRTDTTDLGTEITIMAEAPPFPKPLLLAAQIRTPEFTPEVGFIETDAGIHAVVSWQGVRYTVEDAYFRPEEEHDQLGLLVGATYDTYGDIHSFQLYGGAEFETHEGWRARAITGIRNGAPVASVGLERRFAFNLPSWKDLIF